MIVNTTCVGVVADGLSNRASDSTRLIDRLLTDLRKHLTGSG